MQGDLIDLQHDAVDLVRQRLAALERFGRELDGLLDAVQQLAVLVDLEPQRRQRLERLPVPLRRRRALDQQRVGEIFEPPLRRHFRVHHAQSSSGGVARVDESRLIQPQALGVERVERLARHDDLAAHLEIGRGQLARRLGIDLEGQGADGLGVFGDHFARHAVAARQRQLETAGGEAHAHRDAVEFELADIVEGLEAGQLARSAVEVAHLVRVERIVEAHHLRAVRRLLDAFARRAADAAGRRVSGDEVGVLGFERFEPPHERVVLGV